MRLEFFFNEDGESQISPIGSFDYTRTALYNEEGIQVDTAFNFLQINDWNQSWNDENTKYSRQYELHLIKQSNQEQVIYQLGINYWGEINNCDKYEINRIQIMINDSLQIDNDFFSSSYHLELPE